MPSEQAFDFSGRKNVATNPVLFPNVLSNYDDFLALAQQLERVQVDPLLGQDADRLWAARASTSDGSSPTWRTSSTRVWNVDRMRSGPLRS